MSMDIFYNDWCDWSLITDELVNILDYGHGNID